jgi:hypothetical protein
MILVQDVGMSGYIPFDGAVVLYRFVMKFDLGTFEKEFNYLGGLDSRKSSNLNIFNEIVFFAVFKRFDDFARSTIIRDIGLLSGYYRAGVVFPSELLGTFKFVMGLRNYLNLYYFSSYPGHGFARSAYTTAWAEYICVDFIESNRSASYFLIQMLGVFEMPLPGLSCEELRYVLGQ